MTFLNFHLYQLANRLAKRWEQNVEARKMIAERIMELGNLLFITLAASQFLGEKSDIQLVIGGSIITIICYTFSYNLIEREKYEI